MKRKIPEQKTFKEPEQLVLPCVEEYLKQHEETDGHVILNMPMGAGKSTALAQMSEQLKKDK